MPVTVAPILSTDAIFQVSPTLKIHIKFDWYIQDTQTALNTVQPQ
jgi:hypothetical protein